MNWHKYPEETPSNNGKYLICEKSSSDVWYDVADYCDNLCKLDDWNFPEWKYKGKAGFVIYDCEYSYILIPNVIAWCEIEEYKDTE